MLQLSNNYAAFEKEVSRWLREGGEDFGQAILAIHQFQRANNRAYADFCAGFPGPVRWQEIPGVPVSAFKSASLRTFPDKETVRTFETSGTTGGGTGRHHFRSLSLYKQVALHGWTRAGLPAGGVISIIPSASEAPHSSLSQMASWLAAPGDFFFNKREALLARLETDPPAVVFGTALAFLDLFEWMGGRSVSLPVGTLAVETGGYKGTRREMPKADLYALFHERLGLSPDAVWNEYGMTELSSQFYTNGLGRPHKAPPWARGLVVHPDSGEEVGEGEAGVLRLFDPANLGSVCAIQTRDLAIRRGGDFELIGRDPAALPRGCSLAADALLT